MTYIRVVALRRDKSCGRVAEKFGLFGFTCLVFKTTCIDAEKPLREGAFFFTRMMLSPPLDKRNTRDKARGLCVSSEGYIGELGVRCLSPIDRGQDSAQQSPLGKLAFLRQKALQFFGASSRRAMWTSKEATCSTWRRPVRCRCDLSPRPVLGLVSDGVLGGNC